MAESTSISASWKRCTSHSVSTQLSSSCHQSSLDRTLVLPDDSDKVKSSDQTNYGLDLVAKYDADKDNIPVLSR